MRPKYKDEQMPVWKQVCIVAAIVVLLLVMALMPFFRAWRRDALRVELVGRHESYVRERLGAPTRDQPDDEGGRTLTYERIEESKFGTRVYQTNVELDGNDIVKEVRWSRTGR